MKNRGFFIFVFIFSSLLSLAASPDNGTWCPEPTNRLVNDYAGELSADEVDMLEQRLVAFNDSTSNQILIIITPTLHGGEIMDVGTRIGTTWGVGQKDLKNGLVILIKSKCDEEPYGDVALLPGYGLEGALPDAFCKHIIDNEMIDPLANDNYYKALTKALCAAVNIATKTTNARKTAKHSSAYLPLSASLCWSSCLWPGSQKNTVEKAPEALLS